MSEQRPNEQLENIEELQKWQDHVLTNKGEEILSQVLAGQLLQEIPSAYIGYMPDLETLDIEQYPKYLSKITELPTIHKQIDIIGKSVNKNETLITVQITNSDLEETFKYNAIILMCKTKTGSIVPYTISGRKIPAFLSKQNVPMRSQFQLATLISTDAHITVTVGKIIDADTVDFDNEGSNLTSTNVQSAIKEVDYKIKAHIDKQIASEEGSHGIRYFNETLQVFKEDNWISVGSGGTGGESGGTGTVVMSPVTNISVKSGDGKLVVSWNDPEDNIWAGTKLVYKIGSYPQNYQDGTLVVDNQEKNKYSTNGIEVNALTNDTKYYFMFFPYDSEQRYSFNVNNKVTGIPKSYKIMTVKIDRHNANPETALTYDDDAIGMTPGSEEWDKFFGYYPCLVQGAKEVGKLQRNDYTKFENGTTADITSGNSGDVMVCFPRLFWRIKQDDNYTYISLTDNPNPSTDFCDLSHFLNNKHFKKIYIGSYLLVNENRSLSGKNVEKQKSINFIQTSIKGKGETYSNITFYGWTYLQILFLLKYKTLKTIKITGIPQITANNVNSSTGLLNLNGMNHLNSSPEGRNRIKVFGLEDFIGEYFVFLSNIEITNKSLKISTDTTNFKEVLSGFIPSNQTGIYGYPTDIYGNNEAGFIANKYNGSYSTFYCSYQVFNDNNKSVYIYSYGSSDSGSSGSLFSFVSLSDVTGIANMTGRIMCFDEEVTE